MSGIRATWMLDDLLLEQLTVAFLVGPHWLLYLTIEGQPVSLRSASTPLKKLEARASAQLC